VVSTAPTQPRQNPSLKKYERWEQSGLSPEPGANAVKEIRRRKAARQQENQKKLEKKSSKKPESST